MKLNLTVAALAAGTSLLFAGTAAAEVTVTTGGGHIPICLSRVKRRTKLTLTPKNTSFWAQNFWDDNR